MGAIEFAKIDAGALLENDARVAEGFDARIGRVTLLVINTARGKLVARDTVVRALQSGHIAGSYL
jgi:hypothetical protein